MRITNFKEYKKGTLQGFFELALDSGLHVRGMTYHVKNGKKWTAFPSKPYEGEDGQTKYQNILHIPSENTWKKFQQMALQALDTYFADNQQDDPEDIPF